MPEFLLQEVKIHCTHRYLQCGVRSHRPQSLLTFTSVC